MHNQTQPMTASPRMPPIVNSNVAVIHELPPLPYELTALEPIISEKTLKIHYGKHHQGYVDQLNKLVSGSDFAAMSLEQIIFATANKSEYEHIFDNAAQVWNHTFFWHSLKPQGGGDATNVLQPMIEASFGDMKSMQREMLTAATAQFGSGWVWLAMDRNQLKIVKTGNAGNVLTKGLVPLLVIDVWEHAYYLDFQNRRADYVTGVLDKLINWDFATENLQRV